jgi:hypothetical protein
MPSCRPRPAAARADSPPPSLQLGGAIGVAVIGMIFFGRLPEGSQLAAMMLLPKH